MPAIDWREHASARAEDMTQEVEGGWQEVDPRQARHGILWHLSPQTYGRVQRMEMCYQCLTAFPARPMRENLQAWKDAERAGYNHIRPLAVAHRLIREGRCPLCAAPINAEALALNDMGENPENHRTE